MNEYTNAWGLIKSALSKTSFSDELYRGALSELLDNEKFYSGSFYIATIERLVRRASPYTVENFKCQCGKSLIHKQNFCDFCGKRLDWSEVK